MINNSRAIKAVCDTKIVNRKGIGRPTKTWNYKTAGILRN